MIKIKNVDLYDLKGFEFKVGDTVKWNKKIFKQCPFKIDSIKTVSAISYYHIGCDWIPSWYNWWELVPTNMFKKLIYYIKFYYWYYTRFKKL